MTASGKSEGDPQPASPRLRVVLFGAGSPMSIAALEALRSSHDLEAIVVPRPARWFKRSDARRWIGSVPPRTRVLEFGSRDFAAQLAGLRPDLFCLASFPHLLSSEILALPRLGTLNCHPSLLPRHRGADPLFWTYFSDDAEAGVTIHWVTERVDAGDVAGQVMVPLERAMPVGELYPMLARKGAAALAAAVDAIATGTLTSAPQDEALVTHEPRSSPEHFHLDFAAWPAERVWHVLSGLSGRRNDLLRDQGGRVLLHGAALRMSAQVEGVAGTIERRAEGMRIHCADGWVEVARPTLRVRGRAAVRRLLA